MEAGLRRPERGGATAGLTVLHVWRSVDAPDQIFFLLDVEDRERAEAYMASPESAAGVEAGALDGEVHFSRSVSGLGPASAALGSVLLGSRCSGVRVPD